MNVFVPVSLHKKQHGAGVCDGPACWSMPGLLVPACLGALYWGCLLQDCMCRGRRARPAPGGTSGSHTASAESPRPVARGASGVHARPQDIDAAYMFEDIGDLDDDLSSLLVPDLDLGRAAPAAALEAAAKAAEHALAGPSMPAAGPSGAPRLALRPALHPALHPAPLTCDGRTSVLPCPLLLKLVWPVFGLSWQMWTGAPGLSVITSRCYTTLWLLAIKRASYLEET
jgi:hypothetical protein